jgi:Fe-S-cluster containining protein
MGEAKRRRQAALSHPQPRPEVARRPAGRPTELLRIWADAAARARQGKPAAMPVPCNGCTACCYQRVNINPARESVDELSQHLDVVRDEHGYFLRRRDDGACMHLGPEGCTVYAHRPRACRAFDCRIFALPGNGASFPISEDGKHTTPSWEFDIRSERDAVIRDAFLLGAAPWLFQRRRDDCNTVMAAVVAKFSHHAAIVEALRAKTERQQAAIRIQFYQEGMQRLLQLASHRPLTMADV